MAEGVVLRSSFGRNIKAPRHGSSGKGFGLGTNDIKPAGLEEHCRTNIDKLLNKMGQHVEQSMIMMANMEYTELMNLEKKLKQLDYKTFQKTSELKPRPNTKVDDLWGPQLFHIIQKSRDTQLWSLADDALRELNALQRSAKAYDDLNKSKPDGTPREKKLQQNFSGSILVRRNSNQGQNHRSPQKGGPMKAVHPVEEVTTKPLQHGNKATATKPDFSKSFIKGSIIDSPFNRSITPSNRPPSVQRSKNVQRGSGGAIYLSKEEHDRLQRKVKQQEMQIEELTTRLSSFASKQLLAGNPNMADLSDKNRPTKIGEKFGLLFDEEWSEAFESFNEKLRFPEEECLRVLSKILRLAFDFCKTTSESQLQDLTASMKMHILHPVSYPNKSPNNSLTSSIGSINLRLSESEGKALQSLCHRHSKEFRKAAGLKSVPDLQEIFKAQDLRKNFQLEPRQLPKPILEYVDACIEITWLMCIQDPPMVITWASERETINTNYYKCYKTSGNIVKICVWPLLLLHSKGPIVSKGYILPNER